MQQSRSITNIASLPQTERPKYAIVLNMMSKERYQNLMRVVEERRVYATYSEGELQIGEMGLLNLGQAQKYQAMQ